MIDVKIDATKMQQKLTTIANSTLRKAQVHSLNTSMITVRTYLKKKLSDDLGLKQKDAAKGMFLTKATFNVPIAALKLSGRGIPLISFGARKIRVDSARGQRIGVQVTVKGQTYTVPGGFMIELSSGKKAIFSRIGRDRLPISQMFSGVLHDVFANKDLIDDVKRRAVSEFAKNFPKDFAFYQGKLSA